VGSKFYKFYKPEFLLDVKSTPNYIEMLKLTGISTITLVNMKDEYDLVSETYKAFEVGLPDYGTH
jgi:hypothetical protein